MPCHQFTMEELCGTAPHRPGEEVLAVLHSASTAHARCTEREVAMSSSA
jgi:hypothetical protein